MDYRLMTAPCGLDCFNCDMYLAGASEDRRAGSAGDAGTASEQAVCRGCRNERGTIAWMNMTEPCAVYACTEGKGIDFCFECADFPCDFLHPYADKASRVPHNVKLFNLCLIRKMGLEAWARSKARSVSDTYFNAELRLLGEK